MAARKIQTYRVTPRDSEVEVRPRLIRGTLAQVQGFILGELSIEPATVEQAVALGKEGTEIEQASDE